MAPASPANPDRYPDVLKVHEVMALLRMGRNQVYDACSRGDLPHRRVGGSIRFSRAAILRWLEGRAA